MSEENLTSIPSKDPEATGRLSLDKGPPGSSSLESFKAMTLPSYKMLSGGDMLESNTPVIADTSKELKEIKKQENMKSTLLSFVTGKKEPENSSEIYLKVKEVKLSEQVLAEKQTNPFEVSVDSGRDHGPDKRESTDVPVAKASLNPFAENLEEKLGKSAASVKPSQSKPIKPRQGVSSEDETKATSTISVSSTVSPSFPSHHSSKDNNPFTSKLGPELNIEDTNRSASRSLKLSAQQGNNPFIPNREKETNEDDPECFTAAPFCLPSPVAGSENNPFAFNWKQESQIESSKNLTKSSLYVSHRSSTPVHEDPFIPTLEKDSASANSLAKSIARLSASFAKSFAFLSATSNQEHDSLAETFADSKVPHTVPSEKLRREGQMDSDRIVPGCLSGGQPIHFYDQIGQILKTQQDEKEVQVVTPLKENTGSIEKLVTFSLDEHKDNDRVNSSDEVSDADSIENWSHRENQSTVDPTGRVGTQRCELNIEDCSASMPGDERIISFHNSGSPLERENETSPSVKGEPPVPEPRIFKLAAKETDMSRTSLSSSSSFVLPPKPAPRSALKLKKDPFLLNGPVLEDSSSLELGLREDASVLSSEKPATVSSVGAALHPEKDELSQSINNSLSDTPTGKQLDTLAAGEFNLKPAALPIIPEVGSDDEQLSDIQTDNEKIAVCEAMSSTRDGSSQLQERKLAPDKRATDVSQTISMLVKKNGPDDDFKSNKSPAPVILKNANQDVRGSEQKDVDSLKESRKGDCPEFSKSVSRSCLSSYSQPYFASSFPSDALGYNKAQSSKKSAAESLDAKVDSSGKKKLLQAWVSPSETHSNQTQQNCGTVPAKLRLHPVKPMNATTNKPPSKIMNITTRILGNENETNLKKYDPSDPAYDYAQLTNDELIQLVLSQKEVIAKRDNQVRELEDYIDNLLVRVMEETPNILQVQAHESKKAEKF